MNEIYIQKEAGQGLSHLIKSFWSVNNSEDNLIKKEKIIPDGYTELIFHYGDPYRININGKWQLQNKNLIAGQIRNYFFLENTGTSKMFAIKFQPWALTYLFDLEISLLTDKVIEIPKELFDRLKQLREIAISSLSFYAKVEQIEGFFENFVYKSDFESHKGRKAVASIIMHNGKYGLKEVQRENEISERSLERYFKTYIGLSPKFYLRIIRFSYIFKLVQEENPDWAEIAFQTGFYDQSHFIKNFKEFTGESPTEYQFLEANMANLFLRK